MDEPLTSEELGIAHSFGHDVPGLISGELGGEDDPLGASRLRWALRTAITALAKAKGAPSTDLLLAALKVARWFIVTAHDANEPYVGKVLEKVDMAIAKGELATGNTEMQHSGP